MLFRPTFVLAALSAMEMATAIPMALPQGTGSGADSCPSDPLTEATWAAQNVDDFLATAATDLATNHVQGFASSLGAPNFFCGLDKFCNAGQPCLPVTLPGWYALVAIQNYNSYMNALNTAVSFAAGIMSLEMPAVINDFWPSPEDTATPIKEMYSMITLGLSVIPFTGPMAKAATAGKAVVAFLSGQVKAPEQPNLFVKWSEVGTTISAAVKEYQSVISKSLQATLNAEIDDPAVGINGILAGGGFLGIAQNFTQADMQENIIESMKLRSIALALQGRKAFVYRGFGSCVRPDRASTYCSTVNGETVQLYLRIGDEEVPEIAETIINKYGISPEVFLKGPSDCFDEHKVQNFTPDMLPSDPKAACIFNLPVCTFNSDTFPGRTVKENCKLQGIDL